MRTYAIVNRKGGVGKTTTAIELAYILAINCEQRVLLIDADSQGNATHTLAPAAVEDVEGPRVAGLADVLSRASLDYFDPDVLLPTSFPRLDICPATEALGDYELECTIGRVRPSFDRLRGYVEALAGEGAYDAVVIDCPPYYSVSCISALAACDSIIIPTGIDAYSATGVAGLVRQIDNIRRACPQVRVAGCLVTQYRHVAVAEDAVQILRDNAPVPVFRTVIRHSTKAVESSWAGDAIGAWSPYSAAARDYRAWVAELLELERREAEA